MSFICAEPHPHSNLSHLHLGFLHFSKQKSNHYQNISPTSIQLTATHVAGFTRAKPIAGSQKELMEARMDQLLIGKNSQNCESMHLPSVNRLLLPPQQAPDNEYSKSYLVSTRSNMIEPKHTTNPDKHYWVDNIMQCTMVRRGFTNPG